MTQRSFKLLFIDRCVRSTNQDRCANPLISLINVINRSVDFCVTFMVPLKGLRRKHERFRESGMENFKCVFELMRLF